MMVTTAREPAFVLELPPGKTAHSLTQVQQHCGQGSTGMATLRLANGYNMHNYTCGLRGCGAWENHLCSTWLAYLCQLLSSCAAGSCLVGLKAGCNLADALAPLLQSWAQRLHHKQEEIHPTLD